MVFGLPYLMKVLPYLMIIILLPLMVNHIQNEMAISWAFSDTFLFFLC